MVIIANLKPRNMRGIKSNGMVLCASNEEHSVVEPLSPPEGAPVGERVWFGDVKEQGEPAKPNQVGRLGNLQLFVALKGDRSNRIVYASVTSEERACPFDIRSLQVEKKKLWDQVQPLLRTNAERVAGFDGQAMLTSAGAVTVASLGEARIS